MLGIVTAIAADDNNWRATMPVWAHVQWWRMRVAVPATVVSNDTLVSYIPDTDDHGFIVSKNASESHTVTPVWR